MSKQKITMGNVTMTNSSMNINQSSGKEKTTVRSKEDYAKEIERLIATLAAAKSKDSQLIEAITDLNDALKEIRKPAPRPSVIRRFLNNSAAILNDIKDLVAPATATAMGLKTLIDLLPQIFK